MNQPEEHQGIYTNRFTGLDVSLSSGTVEPSSSTVFQNCDVSSDGAIIRRPGTRLFFSLDFGANPAKTWESTIKTRNGTEYLVIVQDGGIIITRCYTPIGEDVVVIGKSILKASVWTKALTNVNFVLLSAPYDRLLILTGNHPPVELSFLERSMQFTVTAGGGSDKLIDAPFSANDYFGWQDRSAASTFVWNTQTLVDYDVTVKNNGFSTTLGAATGLPVGTAQLTIASITWQWWAEAAFYTGAEFNQSVTRVNVTKVDQNVPVPPELITDYPPILSADIFTGLFASSNSAVCADNTFVITAQPQTALQYNFTSGGVYDYNAAYTPQIAPYFLTFGTTQALNTVSVCHIHRRRILPFRSSSAVPVNDLRVYVDNVAVNILSGTCLAPGVTAAVTSYNPSATSSNYAFVTIGSNPLVRGLDFMAGNTRVPFDAFVRVIDLLGKTYFGASSQNLWLLDRSAPTPTLDGRYVPAYGLGQFCSYLSGVFPTLGTIFRDRLVLKCESVSDQLVASCNADAIVPNEFYTMFQVTGSLKGDPTDPFTFNVAADTKNSITAMTTWQDSLLVFTSENVFGVRGEPFSDGTVRSTLIASQGAFNNSCVVVSELSVVFLNRFGLFDLVNKQNTSELGVVERSQKVRPLFNNDIASTNYDQLHWIHFDDNTTSLWVGLATNDTLYTSRHLVLNTTWDSWATFVGAVPYLMRKPVKLYNRTVLFCRGYSNRWIVTAITNQSYYFDFASYVTNRAWTDDTVIATQMEIPFSSTPQLIYKCEQAFMPGLVDAEGTDITKVISTWVNTSLVQTPITARLPIADLKTTKWLVGNPVSAPTRYLPFVAASAQAKFNVYPQVTAISSPTTPANYTFQVPTTVDGVVLANVTHNKLRGIVYQSIAASPVFNLASMGRLKRLKRLHIQFDPTVTIGSKYNFPGLTAVQVLNMATVAVTIDNRATSRSVVNQALTTQPFVDITQYAVTTEAIGNVQHTITLQGQSTSYRWFVVSVGAEAFKLNGFEFDVTPQRSKTYQRG
jgi:hypothetical protein